MGTATLQGRKNAFAATNRKNNPAGAAPPLDGVTEQHPVWRGSSAPAGANLLWFQLVAPSGRPKQPKVGLHALANPESFTERIGAEYSKRAVLGLSHEIAQYIRTRSREISMTLSVYYQLFVQKGWAEDKIDPLQYRDFFSGLLVPAKERRAPSRVQVLWPGQWLNFVGVVTSADFEYTRFNEFGYPLDYRINITLVETPSKLMTAQSVMLNGIGTRESKG
jgi:hypothetical protein